MNENISITEKYSADKSELGFEYQFYFFLWKLLEMRQGETISWEVKDDVSLDLSNGNTYLFQIKHTTQKNTDNNPISLTDLDMDLWKTLSNWSKIILQFKSKKSKIEFISKTTFVLGTNKTKSKTDLFENINNFKNGTIGISKLKLFLKELQNKTKNDKIYKFINDIITMDNQILCLFFKHLEFHLEMTDLVRHCKESIKEKMIPPNKIDDVYNMLYSSIRNDNFITIEQGEKVSISFDVFYKKYRSCFDRGRSGKLVINRNFNFNPPDKIEEQIFIRQLIDIGDIEKDDFDSQIEFTRFKLLLKTHLEEWHQKGDITDIEKKELLNDGICQWKNEFRSQYREMACNSSCIKRKACQIIDELRRKKLTIKDLTLETDMSNGIFYYLADIPRIGFLKNWQDKYAKKL